MDLNIVLEKKSRKNGSMKRKHLYTDWKYFKCLSGSQDKTTVDTINGARNTEKKWQRTTNV